MGDELKEVARMYGDLFVKSKRWIIGGSQNSQDGDREVIRKDLYHSLQVIAERLLALEEAVEKRNQSDAIGKLTGM